MTLTEQQKLRYDRNIRLKGFGEAGQEKLLNSKVLVIGAGGLGSPAILYLAAAGIGTIGIADDDKIDLSNLQRQILHVTNDIGNPKNISAQERVNLLNPDVKVILHSVRMTAANILSVLDDYDFILDCVDSAPSKYLINDACVLHQKPFCHAGVLGFAGQILTYLPGHACMRCAFEDPSFTATPTAMDAGVLGAVAGAFGSIQACEAIKYLTCTGRLLTDSILHMDLLHGTSKNLPVKRDRKCPVCGKNPSITALS